jgi:hypothetical protein
MSENRTPDAHDAALQVFPYEATCPDCRVRVGEEHIVDVGWAGCGTAICLVTGCQRLMCDLDHDCGRDKWTGWIPGLLDCERLGWMIGPGFPDLARLYTQGVWDPVKRQWDAPA